MWLAFVNENDIAFPCFSFLQFLGRSHDLALLRRLGLRHLGSRICDRLRHGSRRGHDLVDIQGVLHRGARLVVLAVATFLHHGLHLGSELVEVLIDTSYLLVLANDLDCAAVVAALRCGPGNGLRAGSVEASACVSKSLLVGR